MAKHEWCKNRELKFFLGAVTLFLVLGSELSVYWGRNTQSIYLSKSLTYSPYKCLIGPSLCDSTEVADYSLWQFENVANSPATGLKSSQMDEFILFKETKTWSLFADRKPLVLLVRGGLLLQEGNQSGALATWAKEPKIAYYLSSLASEVSDSERAIKIYELSVAVNPTVEAFLQLGQQFYKQKSYEEALTALQRSAVLLEMSSINVKQRYGPFVFLYLGHSYRQLGNLELASANYGQALVLKQDWVDPILGLAEIDLAVNDLQMARRRLETLITQSPNSSVPYYRLALVYLELGDLSLARKTAEELVEHYANYPPGWQLLGNVAFQQGDFVTSLNAYKQYLIMRPDDLQVEEKIKEIINYLD